MSILVTGGAGFIGSHLMNCLVAKGEKVVSVDNFDDYYSPEVKRRNIASLVESGSVKLYTGDIRDGKLCEKVFLDESIDKIVHLAARAGVRASLENPLEYVDVNCRGTMNLLELSKKHGVKQFVFGSSSSVYGKRNDTTPFLESDPCMEPVSPYAATKRAGELFCYDFHQHTGVSTVCLRFFTVYGPRQRPDMAIHKFTRLIANDESVPMFGDGHTHRDYTFFSDIVDGIVAALDLDNGFEIINLGDSRVVELAQLLDLIQKELGKTARIERMPEQEGDVPITCADITKAKKLLGYSPKVPIEEGVKEFVGWYRDKK